MDALLDQAPRRLADENARVIRPFCTARVQEALKDPSWDLSIGHGLPGFSFHHENGKWVGTYSRFSDGVEPLLLWRGFHGMREGYWEVSEEFRLYFNLYEDHRSNKFILIDDNGDDEEVILITEHEIKIKLRLLKEFLAVKKMWLALFFDFNRFSEQTIEELGIKAFHEHRKGADFTYSIGARNWSGIRPGTKSQGFLMGKKLISGLKNFEPKMSSTDDNKCVDFIVGVDENGADVTCSANEPRSFLTPVHFRKDVLSKYYSQPEKYSVEDGYLRCGGMWGLQMDNNHRDFVMAFLGDLGRLSYKEQLHWRSFNMSGKARMSHTAWARSIEGQFADPEKTDLFFKQKLASFQDEWESKFGWRLLKPLNRDDEHYLKTLRVPLTNEQKEFDEQVLALTKVFIDSLNEEELERGLTITKENPKGLDKLEAFLSAGGFRFVGMLEFLRNLQALRSTGVAHRKSHNYEKVKEFFAIGQKDLSEVFDDILVKCVWTLNTLERNLLKRDPGKASAAGAP